MGGNEGVTLMDGSIGALESPLSDSRERRRRHRQPQGARGVRHPLAVHAELATQEVSARALAAAPRPRARGFERARSVQRRCYDFSRSTDR